MHVKYIIDFFPNQKLHITIQKPRHCSFVKQKKMKTETCTRWMCIKENRKKKKKGSEKRIKINYIKWIKRYISFFRNCIISSPQFVCLRDQLDMGLKSKIAIQCILNNFFIFFFISVFFSGLNWNICKEKTSDISFVSLYALLLNWKKRIIWMLVTFRISFNITFNESDCMQWWKRRSPFQWENKVKFAKDKKNEIDLRKNEIAYKMFTCAM